MGDGVGEVAYTCGDGAGGTPAGTMLLNLTVAEGVSG